MVNYTSVVKVVIFEILIKVFQTRVLDPICSKLLDFQSFELERLPQSISIWLTAIHILRFDQALLDFQHRSERRVSKTLLTEMSNLGQDYRKIWLVWVSWIGVISDIFHMWLGGDKRWTHICCYLEQVIDKICLNAYGQRLSSKSKASNGGRQGNEREIIWRIVTWGQKCVEGFRQDLVAE